MATTTLAAVLEPVAAEPVPEVWTVQDLAAVQLVLERGAERLRREIGSTQVRIADPMNPLRVGGADDSMAFASHAAELEHQLSTLDNADAVLAQTERALQRLADGTYTSCEACARPVGRARQQAFPRAVTCLRCQRRRDRRSGR